MYIALLSYSCMWRTMP